MFGYARNQGDLSLVLRVVHAQATGAPLSCTQERVILLV
jgi:hypothetical protein